MATETNFRQGDLRLSILDKKDVNCFYHITHINNLTSILSHGLLSHHRAHCNYQPTDISDQAVNNRRHHKQDTVFHRSLHDYVPAYFRSRNPMSYALRHLADKLVILKIRRHCLFQKSTLFTDGNASCFKTSFFNKFNDLKMLNWDCLNSRYWGDFEDGKRLRCAEVLIPDQIPTEAIIQIATKSNKTYHTALDHCTPERLVIKQPELFF